MKTGISIGITLALLLLLLFPIVGLAEEGIVTDPEDDVFLLDYTDIISEEVSTEKTSTRPNVDIIKVSYQREEGSAEVTVTLEVNSRGEIEDGDFSELGDTGDDYLNFTGTTVQYVINIETDQNNFYSIDYINNNCTLDGVEEIDYTVSGPVLTATFDLENTSENITEISATTVALDFNTISDIKMYFDAAPDSSLFLVEASADPVTGETGESIEFTGDAYDELGVTQTPYTYTWDFDDGTGTHTGQSISHSFQYAGTYTVELTVEDSLGSQATDTFDITITQGSGGNGDPGNGNGDNGDDEDSGLLLFVGIIGIIVIVGIAVLVFVIRR